MKLAWISDWDSWGNGKGYTNHNNNMRDQAKRLGADLVSPEECDIAIDIVVPPNYKPIPGKFNILFTMYEMDSVPPSWIPFINQADALIVPCKHNKQLFKKVFDGPIDVCQEGFTPSDFPYVQRTFPDPGKFFNFLWVGASNPRKGYEFVCGAWELWLRDQPEHVKKRTRLIMKTTKGADEEEVKAMFNCIIDSRKLPFDELKEIYYASHAFLLPSLGEGWGLTLHEAQASGAPCIYTPWSGPQDFMLKDYAYPLKFKMGDMKAMRPDGKGGQEAVHTGKVAKPDLFHIVKRMEQIYYDYEKATIRAKKASDHLHRNFTWDHAGEVLMSIIETRYKEWKSGEFQHGSKDT